MHMKFFRYRRPSLKTLPRETTAISLLLLLFLPSCHAQEPPSLPPIEIHFSPKGGCTDAAVKEINTAKSEILVQAYSFTSVPIAKALVAAHKRGVKIQVILDKSQRKEKYSSADFVRNSGIPTLIDARHAIAHNKVMVIDGGVVVTGSFNFTSAAENNNAENRLVIRDQGIADKYAGNWNVHADHSEAYEQREKGYSETHKMAEAAPAVTEAYVASKRSAVFHKADCKSAATISEKNLVHYATREEAVEAGKKPCGECQP
jgi:phosphatidylserine/phosphatidylglycerophosphate/cardiolipin synthase-like enzyme